MVDLPAERFGFFLLLTYFLNFTAEATGHSIVQITGTNATIGTMIYQVGPFRLEHTHACVFLRGVTQRAFVQNGLSIFLLSVPP